MRARYVRWRARKAADAAAPKPDTPTPATSGSPLPETTRKKMEPHVGVDLSGVRVHAGVESAHAAEQLGAKAFTVGNDVHFGAGELRPNTKEGDKLLAHELAHVAQGQRAGIQRKADAEGGHDAEEHADVSHPDEPSEKEADAVAEHVGEQLHDDGAEHSKKSALDSPESRSTTQAPGAGGKKIARKPGPVPAPSVGGGRKVFLKRDNDRKGGAAPEHSKRDIDRKPSAGASDADWVHYLSDLHRFLRDQTGAEKDQLLDIRANREAHPVVGAISDAAASIKARENVKVPDEGIWDQVFAQLNKAHALFAGDKPDLESARREMATAVRMFEDAHRKTFEYRSRSEGGAETAAHTLRGIEIGCDITLTILSAGMGAGSANLLKLGVRGTFRLLAEQTAKSGLLKTAAKAAAVGGINKLAQGGAEEASNEEQGVEGEFNVGRVLREAGEAAAMNFFGVLVGGSLSKLFMRQLGEILGSRMAPEGLLALAEKYGVEGVIPPELFVSKGWRFLVGVAGDACTTTLLTALSALVEQLRTGGKHPTGEQFVEMVVKQMIQNGLLQLVFATVTHGKAKPSAAPTRESQPSGGGAGPQKTQVPPHEAPTGAAARETSAVPDPAKTGAAAKAQPSAGQAQGEGDQAAVQRRMAEMTEVHDPKKSKESQENDEAFKQRKIENEKLHGDPARLGKDLDTAGIGKEKYDLMKEGDKEGGGERLPLAFDSPEQFEQFKAELAGLVDSLQVNGKPISAAAKVIGTSVNFYSGNPKKPLGHHYDRLGAKTGDVDIELMSPELTRAMLQDPASQANEKVVVGGKKTIFKNQIQGAQGQLLEGGFHSKFPAFKSLCDKWSKVLGREVDIKLRIDMTPPSKVPKPTGGPIEILRKER